MLTKIASHQTSAIAIAQTTEDLLRLWLHRKAAKTAKAYRRDIYEFLTHAGGVELNRVTLNDLQEYEVALGALGRKPATIARKLAAIKSLLSFVHKIGFSQFNPGAMIEIKPSKDKLNERILSRDEVMGMIYHATNQRDRLIIKTLYKTGLRCEELTRLTWSDVKPNDNGGAVLTVFGKGGKTRAVIISPDLYQDLLTINTGGNSDPIFGSRKGGNLTTTQVGRIVRSAANAAGVEKPVSPHWLRHSHASHSLENGAPIHVVQKSLGHASITTTERYLHANPKDGSSLYL